MKYRRKLKNYKGDADIMLSMDRSRWHRREPDEVTLQDPFAEKPEYAECTAPAILADLIRELWKHKIRIFDFGQKTNESYCELGFEYLADALHFFKLVIPSKMQFDSDDQAGHFEDKIAGYDFKGDDWKYKMAPRRQDEGEEIDISIDVSFPPSHIDIILEMIRGKKNE